MVRSDHFAFSSISTYTDAYQDDVVTKPFKISELIPKMHTLIEKIST
jgi:DNA-binding response OmpR family regulator